LGSINNALSVSGKIVVEPSVFLITGKLIFTGMACCPGLGVWIGLGDFVETHLFNVLFTLYPFLQRVPSTCGYESSTGDKTGLGIGAGVGTGILVETHSFFFLFIL
jgi:hypothetical protein